MAYASRPSLEGAVYEEKPLTSVPVQPPKEDDTSYATL